ncbi:MAG: ACT domain-containing protein, partial [Actinobacteria bacterium]|nr:ACT domain-containing protein [Actinomycetota bacterium]
MPLYRLRVELPDRPGALAHVAALIADSGASVISLDIH